MALSKSESESLELMSLLDEMVDDYIAAMRPPSEGALNKQVCDELFSSN